MIDTMDSLDLAVHIYLSLLSISTSPCGTIVVGLTVEDVVPGLAHIHTIHKEHLPEQDKLRLWSDQF